MKVEVRTKEEEKKKKKRGYNLSKRNESIEKHYKRHLNKMRKLVGPTVDKSKRIYMRRIKPFNKIKYTTLSWKQ